VVSSTPRPHFTPGKDTVPILQEAGWASGPVWTGGKSRSHRDSIPDRPARSQSLYRLSYPAHPVARIAFKYCKSLLLCPLFVGTVVRTFHSVGCLSFDGSLLFQLIINTKARIFCSFL